MLVPDPEILHECEANAETMLKNKLTFLLTLQNAILVLK